MAKVCGCGPVVRRLLPKEKIASSSLVTRSKIHNMKIKTSTALIINTNKVLLLLRDDILTIPNPNTWQTIGGHVEEGETFDEAIKREIYEETNLKPANIHHYGYLERNDAIMSFYVAYLSDDEIKDLKIGNEGQDLKFFTIDEIKELELAFTIRVYFEKYLPQLQRLVAGEILKPKELGLVQSIYKVE